MLTGRVPFPGNNALVRMNSRLTSQPVPPREIDPDITPEMQEIIWRALEKDPKNRYASAREMANDLLHPDRVRVTERQEAPPQSAPRARASLVYGTLLVIPVLIFGLLLLVARQG
jgi:serine/threonine protein kinase